jgi:hypothetical protein
LVALARLQNQNRSSSSEILQISSQFRQFSQVSEISSRLADNSQLLWKAGVMQERCGNVY